MTVTHPDVTRDCITTEEVVALVVQAGGAMGELSEVLVLDLDAPVRIDDVVRRLIAQSGKNVEIEYTGLRSGEQLHECLLGAHEVGTTRSHPTILHTSVAPIFPSYLKSLLAAPLAEVATSPGKSAEPHEFVTSMAF